MADKFASDIPHLSDPAGSAAAVVANDNTDLTFVSRALYVGTSGDLTIVVGGATVTFKNASGLLPVRASRVKATGTTAADIVALW